MHTAAGQWHRRFVPASLLAGAIGDTREDGGTDDGLRRTFRDWTVDSVLFLLCAAAGVILYNSSIQQATADVPTWMRVTDIALGVAACLALWARRRAPLTVGILTTVVSALSVFAGLAGAVGLFTVAVHRRATVAIALAVANVAAATVFTVVRPQDLSLLVSTLVNVAFAAGFLAWGLFVRARRQLVLALRERAERAESEQQAFADRARLAERARIAREMHDVLAHRISLMALHAGGLQVSNDLPAAQVRETAGLLRSTAQQALEELRDVIGVLRDDAGVSDAPSAPQPTLADIARLVEESRRAGAKIEFAMDVPDDVGATGSLGRDAYRIVQEALTNVTKHARGTSTSIRVSGAPGDGLRVDVRNRMPLVALDSTLPGSGSGLLGLAERVSLAGGTLQHGPTGDGEFVVDARLTW